MTASPERPEPPPSIAAQIGSALAVIAICALVWWVVAVRSAPPPPPRPVGLFPPALQGK